MSPKRRLFFASFFSTEKKEGVPFSPILSYTIPMLQVILLEPEIPQNTGNIARTCAATGAALHLVEPLGFSLDDKYMRRAGLDYWPLAQVSVHPSLDACLAGFPGWPLFLFTTKAARAYTEVCYPEDCLLLFGKETQGLPEDLLKRHPEGCVRIPMRDSLRSLNLSNSAAIAVYEALRQQGFPGLL